MSHALDLRLTPTDPKDQAPLPHRERGLLPFHAAISASLLRSRCRGGIVSAFPFLPAEVRTVQPSPLRPASNRRRLLLALLTVAGVAGGVLLIINVWRRQDDERNRNAAAAAQAEDKARREAEHNRALAADARREAAELQQRLEKTEQELDRLKQRADLAPAAREQQLAAQLQAAEETARREAEHNRALVVDARRDAADLKQRLENTEQELAKLKHE